jgi:hypothetical protein
MILFFSIILVVILVIILITKKKERFTYLLKPSADNNFLISREGDFIESISGFPPNTNATISLINQDDHGAVDVVTFKIPVDKNGVMRWTKQEGSFPTQSLPISAIVFTEMLIKPEKPSKLQATSFIVSDEIRKCMNSVTIKHFPVDTVDGRQYLRIENNKVSLINGWVD